MRFCVYEHTLVKNNNQLIRRQFIVVQDEDKNIIRWTDWHKYAKNPKRSLSTNVRTYLDKRASYAVKLLNYVFFDKYHIERLTDITADMVKDFLTDYGMCRLPDDDPDETHRTQDTVNRCVINIIDFLELMIRDNPNAKMKIDDLYRKEKVFSKYRRKMVERKVTAFDVYCIDNGQVVFRDITNGAFQIIMDEIATNRPEILMLAALGAFAGLRPSEACNVRREDSELGPGLLFEIENGEVVNVLIDLQEEYNLRSDLVSVGGIKKPRVQKVYHAFIESFMDCYNIYMTYMENRPYEAQFGALSVTSTGKARTNSSYSQIFREVIVACIPKMLASDDPQTVHYGHLLQEHHLGPHIFRHWFSMMLTLYGEEVNSLMSWRGDKSPESSLTYIQNKSELEKQYRKVNEETFNYLLWKADKMHRGTDDQS